MAYTPEQKKDIQTRVCRGVAAGMSVSKCCAGPDMPNKDTIFAWLMDDQDFSDQYARARENRADARSDRIDELTDEVKAGTLGHAEARVIIDAEKWQAGKENSKRYGDKINVDADVRTSLSDDQLEYRVAFLLGKAGIGGASGGTGETQGEA